MRIGQNLHGDISGCSEGLLYYGISSRALRSLPLSVMMSGYFAWSSGGFNSRGANGNFWASTPYSYTDSRYLRFDSTTVYPKSGASKPYGLTLRCVARFKIFTHVPPQYLFGGSLGAQNSMLLARFLPELSAAFLFRL